MTRRYLYSLAIIGLFVVSVAAQNQPTAPSRLDVLRGEYGQWRANNDLLSYDLDVRVEPDRKYIRGRNRIRFRMLRDDNRIQLDLYDDLSIDNILVGVQKLKYVRELNTVYVDFPFTLKKGTVYSVDFQYSGFPKEIGRFGGLAFRKDPAGRTWITTANQGIGASVWWPNKDQQQDEVENMTLHVTIPSALTDVSNGRLTGKTDLGDGYTRYDWAVHYPINNYSVSLNIGTYEHFSDHLGDLTLDYYCLPEDLQKAKRQFAQAKPMLAAYEKYFGPYPFPKDGYKLIEVPYSGMEHQSAVTYGNHFANGYLERDWTGVGVSLKFDFIIVHESAHEWFGNAITASDVADEWLQEGWATYAECVYVEALFGREDAIKYVNGYQPKVKNLQPIITARGINVEPGQDQYFKGALFLNTLRSVINNDRLWWRMVREYSMKFRYQNIRTEDMLAFFNQRSKMNLTPIFTQYLNLAKLPVLELRVDDAKGTVSFRWDTDVAGFAMPVKIGTSDKWTVIRPTTAWQTVKTDIKRAAFAVATELYYINVEKN
ncbi:MAG: M1 family metallopeptidase [Pyrinomonadaceae bacterium]